MKLQHGTSGYFNTRSTYALNFLQQEEVVQVKFPTEYFCSPQFYYKDQLHFEKKPRQLQAFFAGVIFVPIPIRLPKLTAKQKKFSEFLKRCYRVGDIFMHQEDVDELRRAATSRRLGQPLSSPVSLKSIFEPRYCMEPETASSLYNMKSIRNISRKMSKVASLEDVLVNPQNEEHELS